MTGRPSIFTDELAATICDRIADGQTLREICRDEAMPGSTTVKRWLRQDEAFRTQYAQAREEQAEHFADEIAEIADDGSNDWMDRQLENGRVVRTLDHEHVSRSKLRIDTRKWLMSKVAPKRYGDRTELTGPGGAPLIPEASPDDVARRLAFMLASGAAAQAPTKD